MTEEEELNSSLEYTPTWVVAGVCFVIVLLSLCAERGLHKLGKVYTYIMPPFYYPSCNHPKQFTSVFLVGMCHPFPSFSS